ncbi:MAG TPA: methyltransferase domain-containing protein [Candidatus Cybelea sp.]|nr:methyltransferase domain-containing protein [Candidatus Cybelea sp.]
MGVALESGAAPASKPSFKERFKAWWEGYELAPAAPESAPPAAAPAPTPEPEAEPAGPVGLDPSAITVMQQIWGEGFSRPGGAASILTLVKPFALNPSMTVMDFGAGLGGGTRTVSNEFGVWVYGFEPDPNQAAVAQELSVKKGAKKAEIKSYATHDFQPKAGSYDCIYSSEALYSVADKDKLLGIFERALKARGQIAITDFVRTEGTADNDPRLADFVTRDGKKGHFWKNADYHARMKALKFDVRVDEDLTDAYRSSIIEAWVNFTQDASGTAYARAHPNELVTEVTLWTKRVAALDSGALQLRRYYAIKMGSSKSS